MTTYKDAITAADELAEQLQSLIEDGRFLPRFFEGLFRLRTALGSARERFAVRHSNTHGHSPVFATVRDRCDQAIYIGGSLSPSDAVIASYAAAVDRAMAALATDRIGAIRPALRGTLRLRSSARKVLRDGRRPPSPPEPYYTSLVKLFPVEAVTLYPLALGIAAGDIVIRLTLIAVIALFVVVLRWFGTQEESGGDADVLAIGVSVASFLLYAASLGGFGYLPGGPEQTRQVLAFITIMWVALVPFVLRHAHR